MCLASAGLALALAAGCRGPMDTDTDRHLRLIVADSVRRELEESQNHPAPRELTRESTEDELQLSAERLNELNEISGPDAYDVDNSEMQLQENLFGEPQRLVEIGLERAVRTALENNLNLQFARLSPAVRSAELVQAEAAFDWNLFVNTDYAVTDNPQVRTFASLPNVTYQDLWSAEMGLQRNLTTGGTLTLDQEFSQLEDRRDNAGVPNSAERARISADLTQPLLRNAGSEVAMSEVRIRENAERSSVAELKGNTIELVRQVEEAYWRLFQAQQELLIQQRLVQRGIEIREQVRERRLLDATPAQIADAGRAVEDRRTDLLTAQTNLRVASRRLKALMNDPELTVGGEVLLLPSDRAIDEPIAFSLLDALQTAVDNRPEIDQAMLSIDDTSIRRLVAENGELPRLDLRLQAAVNGLDSGLGSAYTQALEGTYLEYLVGLAFEQPLGNRGALALSRQRRLERMQSVISFRNTMQQITLEMKDSLDQLSLNYRLIEQSKVARMAAAEVLRALLVEKELVQGYTVERLDLELNRQEDLAQQERSEVSALAEYNIAIANFYASMGTLLQRNGIDFVAPNPDQSFTSDGELRSGAQ